LPQVCLNKNNSTSDSKEKIEILFLLINGIPTILSKPHKMSSTRIIDFWKENRNFWITPPSKQQEVDTLIYNQFWNYNWQDETPIGQIIWLDQFSRHFQRLGHLTELQVENNRIHAITIFYYSQPEIDTSPEIEVVFALMPFKHLKEYEFIFSYIHYIWIRLKRAKLVDFPILHKFYMDTYKKAYTQEKIAGKIITEHTIAAYDPANICDFYPESYKNGELIINASSFKPLLDQLEFGNEPITVSLSGGVDSMVMLALLKYKGADVRAVHIIYGNRKESEDEYQFLAEFCKRLNIPLAVYRIEWLKRGQVDRQFYEDMTRDIRFAVYRSLATKPNILLGHIKDDIIENIWTNITHCQHLDNLKKMVKEEEQLGIKLIRPFLTVEKSQIYEVSKALGIPYLKNTTPSWSNRGKFREHFYQATVEQFGTVVDDKLIEFSEAVQSQNRLLNTLLYEPIYESFKDNTINITTAIKANLDASNWLIIFEHICHKNLARARPSINCIRDFCSRLERPFKKLNVEMGKGLKIQVNKSHNEYFMTFITN
jgi:tRNA(Ile)-lysidine synthetase-like protein